MSTAARVRTTESPAVRWLLTALALGFMGLFLVLPLAAVFVEALRGGWGAYWNALHDPDALAAIRLTLLTAAKLDVARLKSRIDTTPPEVSERLRHLTETLNGVIALKRRIIENLRPSSLANLGLTASLEILTREFAQHSGIAVDTDLQEVDLSPALQLTVYRIVQESLTNIGKYAQARHATVRVQRHAAHVTVEIRDDGTGFTPGAVPAKSHGLAGMRHRVEAAGGHFAVHSQPGQGTVVSADIPWGT